MMRRILIGMILICHISIAQQTMPTRKAEQKEANSTIEFQRRHAENGANIVEVDPKQPYRPIPANRAQTRESIFEFYLNALNPRQINWGEEIDRRIALLAEQSIHNPYFRLCAAQMAFILVLLLTCWLWWDNLRRAKWVAAECLADAINAKRIADHKALEAISQYNRHIDMCNRVIENQESGLATGAGSQGWQRELRDLQTQLAAERAKSASLEAALKNRDETQAKLERRLQQLEKTMLDHRGGANAELVARLQRAEAELSSRKAARR